jgi:hypothetical protein
MEENSLRHSVDISLKSNVFVGLPKVQKESHSYLYPGLEVFDTLSKGLGIRATDDLPVGFVFPYGGVFITDTKSTENLMKNAGRGTNFTSYYVASSYNASGCAITWLDGHPNKYSKTSPKFGWIGAIVNEPGVNQQLNAELVRIDDCILPNYPEMDSNMNVFVNLIKPVGKGEEILVSYGYSKRVYSRLGYMPSHIEQPKMSVLDRSNVSTRLTVKRNYKQMNDHGH